ncbi:MAG: hypothetical protein WBA23_24755 [Tunicatimonas sp.]|uniref:hypothetical protein n=1 Tax=Tunicatimonas sp. TaxID=1940096 RepID=UPI003C775E43
MKPIPLIIALVVAGVFLYSALNSSNAFNLIPISLHRSFLQGFMEERTFIKVFDALFAIALVRLTYNAVSKIIPV